MLSQQAVKHIGNSRGKIMGKIIIIIIIIIICIALFSNSFIALYNDQVNVPR